MSAFQTPCLTFVLPGDPGTRTGGYIYDARIAAGLRARGWRVDVVAPEPGEPLAEFAERTLSSLPEGGIAVVDGLAYGHIPQVAADHAKRLALVALVHHPLALETGLDATTRQALIESERAALAHARLVITPSAATKRDVEALGVAAGRIAIVPPGVDRAEIARGSGEEAVAMLCVASLIPRKGHLVLLSALTDLTDRAWTLRLVGGRELDPHFAGLVDDEISIAGLEDRVTLVGELDEARLAQAYDAADLFVLASLHEGYGMVLTEALARGLPIVTTSAGAIPDVVPPTAAELVPPGDAVALRGALARAIDDPAHLAALRNGALAAREALIDWDKTAERFADQLRAALPVAAG